MLKERQNRKYVFSILVLLSISGMWSINSNSDLSISQKIIFACLNFSYLFFVAEYIEIIMYRRIIKNVFGFNNYFPPSMYNLYNVVLPIVSMFIYVFAWALYLSNSIFDVQTSGILILMSQSCIQFSVFGKNKIIFANKDAIAIGFRLISYDTIKDYDLDTEKKLGISINKITAHMKDGDNICFSVDSKYLGKLVERLARRSSIE